MRKNIVIHPGTQHAWQTALAFQEAGQLDCFITSVYFSKKLIQRIKDSNLPEGIKAKLLYELGRRNALYLEDELVERVGFEEYIEVAFRRLGFFKIAAKIDSWGNKRFLKKCRDRVSGTSGVDVVWGYNMSFKEVLEDKRNSQALYVLDQTIGNWEVYNELVANHYSEYKNFFRDGFERIPTEVIDRNYQEIELADKVVFGSEFSKSTFDNLQENGRDFQIIPYGFDESIFHEKASLYEGGTVKFVFVGLLTPRKGIHLLLNVFDRLVKNFDVHLTLVGGNQLPPGILEGYLCDRITYLKSIPRGAVPDVLIEHHCFVFPSLFEGGGIVLYEACAAGLAIVQSKNCGDGVGNNNGLLIDSLTEESLECAIVELLESPSLIRSYMSKSREWSMQRRWENYREKVRSLVDG